MLDLGARGTFRRLVERANGSDFSAAVGRYVDEVTLSAESFTESLQARAALNEVIGSIGELLALGDDDPLTGFRFTPEGGSASGLLRSLGPSVDFGDGVGALPTWRRGSTQAALFRVAESLALSARGSMVLAVDDLGDGTDAASAAHLATKIRSAAQQAWVTTRLPAVAEVFEPQEVLRLGRDGTGGASAWHGKRPRTKAEAVASKHWHRNLLPALTYRSVVVVEGPNDFAALHTLALRRAKEHGESLPATRGVALINAGMTGSGGYHNVLKLAAAAREMGLRAIGLVDGDTRTEPRQYLADNHSLADAVIRLPSGVAIEAAICGDLPLDTLREALKDVIAAAGLHAPPDVDRITDERLVREAIRVIKNNSLHSGFVEALPAECLPPIGIEVLRTAVDAASGDTTGIVQL